MKIYNFEILKRTFVGVNDDPLTSSYGTSKKWLLRYNLKNYDYKINEVFRTKKECIARCKDLKKKECKQ